MTKRIATVFGVLVLLLTACGGDSEKPSAEVEKTPVAATAVADDAAPTAEPTRDRRPVGGPKGVFQPLSVMSGPLFGGGSDLQSGNAEVDPGLTLALLTEADLPEGYMGIGDDFTFTMDSPAGAMEMAMRMFFEGDVVNGAPSSIVMSAAMSMPAGSLEEFDAELEELRREDLTAEDLQEMMGESGVQGMTFEEFKLIETPGLGQQSFGMHMVLDMSGFAGGGAEGMDFYENGLAFDMYLFVVGERVHMLMVMWPADEAPGVDGLALAEVMESRVP